MTQFSDLYLAQWPVMLGNFGEPAVYADASGAEHDVTAVVSPRSDAHALDVTWETQLRQAEILIAADELAEVSFTPRTDTITARGVTYTAMERDDHNGAVYRFRCERDDIDAVSLRGRRY